MKVDKLNNKLSLTVELIKNKIQLLLIISPVLIFIFIYALWDFSDNNQKITITCNKAHNECKINTNGILYDNEQYIIFDKLGDAVLHNVGCHYMSCYYNIQIPYGNSYIKLYSSSENKKVQEWIIKTFNNNKNNPKINLFELNTEQAPFFFSLLSFYVIIAVPLLLLIILFLINIKVKITVDREHRLLIIENKRILGRKTDKIPLNRIKDIEIENLGKYCIVTYRLKSEVAYEIFRLESEEISEKVVKQIKEFIFDE